MRRHTWSGFAREQIAPRYVYIISPHNSTACLQLSVLCVLMCTLESIESESREMMQRIRNCVYDKHKQQNRLAKWTALHLR